MKPRCRKTFHASNSVEVYGKSTVPEPTLFRQPQKPRPAPLRAHAAYLLLLGKNVSRLTLRPLTAPSPSTQNPESAGKQAAGAANYGLANTQASAPANSGLTEIKDTHE